MFIAITGIVLYYEVIQQRAFDLAYLATWRRKGQGVDKKDFGKGKTNFVYSQVQKICLFSGGFVTVSTKHQMIKYIWQ